LAAPCWLGAAQKKTNRPRSADFFLRQNFAKNHAPDSRSASLLEIYWSLAAPCWLGAAQKKQAISRAAPIFF
jgi:hypothetical protein